MPNGETRKKTKEKTTNKTTNKAVLLLKAESNYEETYYRFVCFFFLFDTISVLHILLT